ncbi:hypothetical protein G6F57_020915 [Rhizopus arrhizus]|nr:hypothetical protein G6F57_020915 [Rhizopus arrhizus]
MASSFLPCSSSTTSTSLLPLIPPAALISSAASWKPLRIETPYWAAPPDRASATPSLMSAACAAGTIPAAISAASSFLVLDCMVDTTLKSVSEYW